MSEQRGGVRMGRSKVGRSKERGGKEFIHNSIQLTRGTYSYKRTLQFFYNLAVCIEKRVCHVIRTFILDEKNTNATNNTRTQARISQL